MPQIVNSKKKNVGPSNNRPGAFMGFAGVNNDSDSDEGGVSAKIFKKDLNTNEIYQVRSGVIKTNNKKPTEALHSAPGRAAAGTISKMFKKADEKKDEVMKQESSPAKNVKYE